MKTKKLKKKDKKFLIGFFLLFTLVVAMIVWNGGGFTQGGDDGGNDGGDNGGGVTTTTKCDPTHYPGCVSTTSTTRLTTTTRVTTTTLNTDYVCYNREGEIFYNYEIEWQLCSRLWQYRLCEWGTWTDWSACVYDDPNSGNIIV